MKTLVLRLLLLMLPVLLTAAVFFPPFTGTAQRGSDSQQPPPNYDALAASRKSVGAPVQTQGQPQMEAGRIVQMEARLGVPTFLWASDIGPARTLSTSKAQGRTQIEAAAREHLGRYAARYRLSSTEVAAARVVEVHDPGMGAIIARFQQSIGGIGVFRDEIKVMMNRQLQLIALAGYLTGVPGSTSTQFKLGPDAAIATALQDLTKTTVDAATLTAVTNNAGGQNPYSHFNFKAGTKLQFSLTEAVRLKSVMFHLPEQFVPAYYLELQVELPGENGSVVSLNSTTGGVVTRAYSYVISAVDGQLLFRKNLVADQGKARSEKSSVAATSYTYRVWADPATKVPYDGPQGNGATPKTNPIPDFFQAPFVAPSDVSLISGPISTNDPWLPDGATETNGNNADAFLDIASPDGFNGADFRGMVTAPGQFLHTYDTTMQPTSTEQRHGAIQQLFYMNNFLHDWYYDVGFTEAAGNAQKSNYGRGGLESDDIKAQGQDYASRNNANMLTPSDGGRPRMRMYVFDANVAKYFEVVSPANIAGKQNVGTGQFGPQAFNVTNEVVQPTTPAGCSAGDYANAVGKFVLVNREPTSGAGSCSIGTKLNNAQAAGAAGFILVNLSSTPNTLVNVTGSLPSFTIPFLTVTWNGAAAIKTELAVPNVVTATMRRDAPGPDRDGTIDNQVVAHEWGHYLSNRLIGDANGINNQQAGGLGEGWGDTTGMILTVRADDINVPSNANWAGVYAQAGYVTSGGEENNGYYYGIRRYPYSTDMTKNPLTFKHIQNGNALPVGPPVRFGADGADNAEVHNTGEVWAVMLWECYAALLRDTLGGSPRLTFQQAQDRMRLYLVTSLKMTPVSPTFTEARDAVLAAAAANDPVDYAEFLQAFAKRGMGIGAVAPDRFSTDNSTVVESFVTGKDLQFLGATLDDTPASCDHDGVLDNGETGKLTITLKNSGDANLGPISATVTSVSAGVTVLNGGNLLFPASVPGGQTTATINVTLNGALSTIQQLDFTLSYGDPTLVAPTTRTQALSYRANTNTIPASTATDTVESSTVLWTTGHGATGATGLVSVAPFVRREVTALQHEFFGTDASVGTDEYLISPVFTVDGSGSFNVQFDHSWGFEFDGGGNYDGAVIEMSVNGGAYADIGTGIYNGTILNYSGNVNPLKGRSGLVQNSAGTIHSSLTQAIAPGSTVQIRFRIGTDSSFGAAGWHIDNIAFTGVVETPFGTVVADTGCLLCPTDITVNNDPNQCGAVVNYAKPTLGTVTCNPDTGTFFSVGMTTVTCMSNAAPNCTFKVTVVDNQPPTVSCPVNQSAVAPVGQNSVVVNYPLPTASDNCSATVTCVPPGNTFSVGVTTVTCKATDAAGNMSQNCSFTVSVCATITLGNLSSGQAGVAYNQSVAASPAGSYTYQVTSGTLPLGLSLNTATGAVTGTPTTVGVSTFRITATGTGSCTGFRDYQLTIDCPTITLTPASLPGGVVGTAYNQTLVASPAGTTYNYAVTTNVLPPGLSLNSATGAITGTPTAAGNYAFGITATGWEGCTKTQSYSLLITGTCSTITINPTTLPGGTLGTAYNQTVSATGGTAPYTFSVATGALPSGLTLDTNTGVISGTPAANGTFSFSVRATSVGGCTGSRQYVMSVVCSALTFNPVGPALPNGTKGVAYNQPITVTPGTGYTFSVLLGSLPPGYVLSAAGVLSGVSNQSGTWTFTVKALAGSCQATKQYTLTIPAPAAPTALAQLNDYDGDGKSDLALFAANGEWRIQRSSDQKSQTVLWGAAGDLPVSGDYDGDGKTDVAVFRPSNGTWYVKRSSDGAALIKAWGVKTDVPVPGDYDGDGQTDLAIWRGGEGNWYILYSGRSADQQFEMANWGLGLAPFNDVPVAGDYDGDGKTDLGVFRRGSGVWYVRQSGNGNMLIKQWGVGSDVPVVNDYDGDGKVDLAVWRGATGLWYIQASATGATRSQAWGAGFAPYNDQAVPGDYDGDGQADLAVWRAAEATWYLSLSGISQNSAMRVVRLGEAGDRPVSARLP